MMALFLQPHFLNPTPSLSSTNPPLHLCKKSRLTQSPLYFLIIPFSYLFFLTGLPNDPFSPNAHTGTAFKMAGWNIATTSSEL